jgi:hypothetical protein
LAPPERCIVGADRQPRPCRSAWPLAFHGRTRGVIGRAARGFSFWAKAVTMPSGLIVCCAHRGGSSASSRAVAAVGPCLLDRRRAANAGPCVCVLKSSGSGQCRVRRRARSAAAPHNGSDRRVLDCTKGGSEPGRTGTARRSRLHAGRPFTPSRCRDCAGRTVVRRCGRARRWRPSASDGFILPRRSNCRWCAAWRTMAHRWRW